MRTNTIKVRPDNSEFTIFTYALSILLSTLMGSCFAMILKSTFEFEVTGFDLFMSALIFSVVATFVMTRKKKIYTVAYMIAVPLVIALILYMNIGNITFGFPYFLKVFEAKTQIKTGLDLTVYHKFANRVAYIFALYDIFIVTVTSFVVVHRKPAVFAILAAAPYFLCAITISYKAPSPFSTVLAFCSVILLIFASSMRKGSRKQCEKAVLLMFIPVFLLAFTVRIVFPQRSYNKNNIALNAIHRADDFAIRNVYRSAAFEKIHDLLLFAENGRSAFGSSTVTVGMGMSGPRSAEDLKDVGFLQQPDVVMGHIEIRTTDPNEDIHVLPSIYLKDVIFDTYFENMWSTNDSYTTKNTYNTSVLNERGLQDGRFVLRVRSGNPMLPYYREFRGIDGLDTSGAYDTLTYKLDTAYSYSEFRTMAFSNLPLRVENLYNVNYKNNYINGTCLFIPESTRKALLESGALPDWFLDTMSGDVIMSDAEKVDRVCEYVSSLHPYHKMTPYPPEDADFVTWFITESETGFCVHYATTATILLRMLNVPTRYVTGYLVSNPRLDEDVEVNELDAHAWIEFYLPNYGWVLDDPTPGNREAASFYNIRAIVDAFPGYFDKLEYDEEPVKRSSTMPDVTQAPMPEGYDPTTASADSENAEPEISKTPLVIILTVLLVLILLIFAVRLAYVLHWHRKFNNGPVNSRAREYYHYFAMLCHVLDQKPDARIHKLAQVAAYSNHELTAEELKTMISIGRKQVEEHIRVSRGSRRLRATLLHVNV